MFVQVPGEASACPDWMVPSSTSLVSQVSRDVDDVAHVHQVVDATAAVSSFDHQGPAVVDADAEIESAEALLFELGVEKGLEGVGMEGS